MFDDFGDLTAALHFIESVVTLRYAPESVDKSVAICQSVTSDAIDDARRHDLLRPPPTDSKQVLDVGSYHVRMRMISKLFQDVRQSAIPRGFGRHGDSSLRYCAGAQIAKILKER
jgi:hypothetical protein